jgi:hypothetical protein
MDYLNKKLTEMLTNNAKPEVKVNKRVEHKYDFFTESLDIMDDAFVNHNGMLALLYFCEEKYGVTFKEHPEHIEVGYQSFVTQLSWGMMYALSVEIAKGSDMVEEFSNCISRPLPVPKGWKFQIVKNGQAKCFIHEASLMVGVKDAPLVILGGGGDQMDSGRHYLPLLMWLEASGNMSDVVVVDPSCSTVSIRCFGRNFHTIGDVAMVTAKGDKVSVNGYEFEKPVIVVDVWSEKDDQYTVQKWVEMVRPLCTKVSYKVCYDISYSVVAPPDGVPEYKIPFVRHEKRAIDGEMFTPSVPTKGLAGCSCRGCYWIYELCVSAKCVDRYQEFVKMLGVHANNDQWLEIAMVAGNVLLGHVPLDYQCVDKLLERIKGYGNVQLDIAVTNGFDFIAGDDQSAERIKFLCAGKNISLRQYRDSKRAFKIKQRYEYLQRVMTRQHLDALVHQVKLIFGVDDKLVLPVYQGLHDRFNVSSKKAVRTQVTHRQNRSGNVDGLNYDSWVSPFYYKLGWSCVVGADMGSTHLYSEFADKLIAMGQNYMLNWADTADFGANWHDFWDVALPIMQCETSGWSVFMNLIERRVVMGFVHCRRGLDFEYVYYDIPLGDERTMVITLFTNLACDFMFNCGMYGMRIVDYMADNDYDRELEKTIFMYMECCSIELRVLDQGWTEIRHLKSATVILPYPAPYVGVFAHEWRKWYYSANIAVPTHPRLKGSYDGINISSLFELPKLMKDWRYPLVVPGKVAYFEYQKYMSFFDRGARHNMVPGRKSDVFVEERDGKRWKKFLKPYLSWTPSYI